MEAIIQSIKDYLKDPLVSLFVATILTLIPIIIDRIHREIKLIWWGSKSTSLKASYFSETGKLKVTYKKSGARSYRNATQGLSVCRFVFWNQGKDAISSHDIPTREPLILNFDEDCEILEIREISNSNSSINFEVISPNQIHIAFEYLDNKQGAIFDVVHTGKSSQPYVSGGIIGGKVKHKTVSPPPITMSGTPRMYLLFGWLPPAYQVIALRWFSTFGLIFLLWLVLLMPEILRTARPNGRWIFIIMVIAALYGYIFLASALWKIAVVPPHLRRFYSELEESD